MQALSSICFSGHLERVWMPLAVSTISPNAAVFTNIQWIALEAAFDYQFSSLDNSDNELTRSLLNTAYALSSIYPFRSIHGILLEGWNPSALPQIKRFFL